MGKFRKLVGIVLLATVACVGVPTALAADGPQESPGCTTTGPQESPGVTGPQESPGYTTDITTEVIVLLVSSIP